MLFSKLYSNNFDELTQIPPLYLSVSIYSELNFSIKETLIAETYDQYETPGEIRLIFGRLKHLSASGFLSCGHDQKPEGDSSV